MSKLRIGEGTYATVYKTIRDGRMVALKEYKNKEYNFLSEVALGMQCDHPNIVKVLDFGTDHLLMQLGKHDLHQEMVEQMPSEEKVLSWLPAMFSSLIYLHENGIVHRDVKDTNFVLDLEGNILLCDLGSCSHLDNDGFSPTTLPSPQMYTQRVEPQEVKMFTDIFAEQLDTRALDAWSLGVTILKFLIGTYPFLSRDPLTEHIKYFTNPLAYLFSLQVPPSFIPLLQVLLSPKQKKRNNLRRIAEKFSIPIIEGNKPIFADWQPSRPITHSVIQEEMYYSPPLCNAASAIFAKVMPPKEVNLEGFARACLYLASCVYDSGTLAEELEESRELAFAIFRQLQGQLYFN